ncbi:YugN family protein [Heyndrickxia acidiproducens]|uniref:YugN family protein n=1 Tax=Heyndrickxia acidiproducens TaxID=1121084 RepID=UPI00035E357E|nr:YugN family protein [Heyndrickxia acidiproducens]
MKFENTGLENLKVNLTRLDDIMERRGMVRAGQWDYERVTYDKKFVIKEGTYYLRVQGYAAEGDVDTYDAVIRLIAPILGKHYYPHGVEYGDDEYFPHDLVKHCRGILVSLKEDLAVFAE